MTVDSELLQPALEARQRAYAPYSKFAVGAAVRTSDGRVFAGCNIENGSLGLTVCAERVAVWNAVASGATSIDSLLLVSPQAVAPCGACRQVLSEFAADCTIWLVDSATGSPRMQTTLSALFPERFDFRAASNQEPA